MFEKIIEEIKKASSIIVVGHIRPDGDCYGSQVAIKELILANFPGKEVYITGTGMPDFFKMLGKMDHPSDEVYQKSLIFVVDLNELYRIEDEKAKALGKNYVLLDHHIRIEQFDFPHVSIEDAVSTAEIVIDMIIEQNLVVTERCANALYLGILTDSGRFQFGNDPEKIFHYCSELVKRGAKCKEIDRILSRQTLSSLETRGYVLSHLHKIDKGLIYIHLSKEEIKKLGIKPSSGSGLCHTFANVIGYPIWATFMDADTGACIIEVRSNKYDVVGTCMKYGGGGHKKAAGVTIQNYNNEIHEQFVNDLLELIKE